MWRRWQLFRDDVDFLKYNFHGFTVGISFSIDFICRQSLDLDSACSEIFIWTVKFQPALRQCSPVIEGKGFSSR